MIEERRSSVRAKRILSIRHRLYKRGMQVYNEPWYLSTTEDMSYNGLLFSSSAAYQKNDIVEIEVIMSGVLDIFKGFGKVVRTAKKESGVIYSIAVVLIDLKAKSNPARREAMHKAVVLKKSVKRK